MSEREREREREIQTGRRRPLGSPKPKPKPKPRPRPRSKPATGNLYLHSALPAVPLVSFTNFTFTATAMATRFASRPPHDRPRVSSPRFSAFRFVSFRSVLAWPPRTRDSDLTERASERASERVRERKEKKKTKTKQTRTNQAEETRALDHRRAFFTEPIKRFTRQAERACVSRNPATDLCKFQCTHSLELGSIAYFTLVTANESPMVIAIRSIDRSAVLSPSNCRHFSPCVAACNIYSYNSDYN